MFTDILTTTFIPILGMIAIAVFSYWWICFRQSLDTIHGSCKYVDEGKDLCESTAETRLPSPTISPVKSGDTLNEKVCVRNKIQEKIMQLAHQDDDSVIDKLLNVYLDYGDSMKCLNGVNVSTLFHRLASLQKEKRWLMTGKGASYFILENSTDKPRADSFKRGSPTVVDDIRFVQLCQRTVELLADGAVGARAVSSILWSLSKILKIMNGGTLFFLTWHDIPHIKALVVELCESSIDLMDEFDAQAISNAYYALGQLHYRNNGELLSLFTHRIANLIKFYGPTDPTFFTTQHIGNMLQSTASLFYSAKDISNAEFLWYLTDFGRKNLSSFIPQELATALFALGKLGYSGNVDFLLECLEAFDNFEKTKLKPVDISNSFLAIGKLLGREGAKYTAVQKVVTGEILTHVSNHIDLFQTHEIANILSAHSRLGLANADFVAWLASYYCDRLDFFTPSNPKAFQPQDLANLFFALGRLKQIIMDQNNKDAVVDCLIAVADLFSRVTEIESVYSRFKLGEFVTFVIGYNLVFPSSNYHGIFNNMNVFKASRWSSVEKGNVLNTYPRPNLNFMHSLAEKFIIASGLSRSDRTIHNHNPSRQRSNTIESANELSTLFCTMSRKPERIMDILGTIKSVFLIAMDVLHEFKFNHLCLFMSSVERVLAAPSTSDRIDASSFDSVAPMALGLMNRVGEIIRKDFKRIENSGHLVGCVKAVGTLQRVVCEQCDPNTSDQGMSIIVRMNQYICESVNSGKNRKITFNDCNGDNLRKLVKM